MSKKKTLFVIKASGQRVPFDAGKVEATCTRAGASSSLARRIAQSVMELSYDGISTREIYRLVLASLAGEIDQPGIRHRYRLKEALMLMGPAGFNFESYLAKILERYGYRIESIRAKVKGRCVEHEVDLSITSPDDGTKIMVECKYHNFSGAYTGLKESMYTHARFLDLKEENAELFDKEMLASNTKVSEDAMRYAACIGQEILSWRYPDGGGLEKLIEDKGLYPVTILKLNPAELSLLASAGLMVAADLLKFDPKQLSATTGIGIERIARLQGQVHQVLR